VAYELLNEAVAHHPDSWNRVSGYVFEALRALEPERTIVLGSNQFCQVQTFPDLRVPEDDHLMLTFHYYNPMLVTHYTAPWDKIGAYRGPVQYPGLPVPDEMLDELDRTVPGGRAQNMYFDRNIIDGHIQMAVEVAEQTGNFLYCGEFGCYWATPLDVRRRWYKDIVSVFKAYGIGWGNWDYKGGFGLITPDGQETGIRDAIFE
jgi:endoglucanase